MRRLEIWTMHPSLKFWRTLGRHTMRNTIEDVLTNDSLKPHHLIFRLGPAAGLLRLLPIGEVPPGECDAELPGPRGLGAPPEFGGGPPTC